MTASAQRFTAPLTVHLFLVRDDDILLLRRFNTGYEDGNYSVIARHLDGGEGVIDAMCREAREEAGIDLDRAATGICGVMHRRSPDSEYVDFFLMSTHWTGEIRNLEPGKCDGLHWVPLDRLPDNTIPYIAAAVENWRGGEWFSAFGWEAV